MRVAVIGAGLAGLTCARGLHDAGARVVILEKSRGVGGRTATRRAGALAFDHGAPVVVRGALEAAGTPWEPRLRGGGRLGGHEVARGAMNAAAKGLAAGLDVRPRTRVAALEGDGRRLRDEEGRDLGTWDRVVVAVPAPQAAILLADAAPAIAARAAEAAYDPCWTAMVAWDASLGVAWEAARDVGILAWAVAEEAKPGRTRGERWVLQAAAPWSAEHLEDEPDGVLGALLAGFGEVAGLTSPPRPVHAAAHRWRYAQPCTPIGEAVLAHGAIVACGDWCGGRDAAAAVASGRAAAALVTQARTS